MRHAGLHSGRRMWGAKKKRTLRTRPSFLLEKQMFCEQAPDGVQPTDNYTEYGYDKTDYQPYRSAFLKKCSPPYNNFHNSVYAGNNKKDDLNKTRKFVKPSHKQLL